ncbi:SpoVA/SpoVAEb family sporulation membrane protein [Geobacillus sp. FSL K6-0789]|uniref:SpoVA/SpoVAEb family sporulation membrane protein n=1 Tax=Geobacillus stearothermophilus TaxID=1422 RepID=A0A0K9HPE4_GEOSE|nr:MULTISPECIES: SpoVA/SpoVAEb family sporulation membrane protein [Geobacillus]AKU25644.1 SpoVA protein [Geobacillus sp. LC300]ATA60523.1 SpoVA protein [Geobacillus stearothermophilus]KAF6509855.1 Stage V sporulation protein AE (SpoVAE) [Geobacillus stearothermophilus]KMY59802.1 SpoVA protein [Geobacillus stearothermophilus]KMY60753.1 SpoVA protein [Geobacillus stearothermophilus]
MEYVRAFLAGGLLCAIVQLIIDRGKWTPAGVAGSLVVFGVLLGFGGVYDPFVAWAGAGATMPLCGFGYWLAKGAMVEPRPEGFVETGAAVFRFAGALFAFIVAGSFAAALTCKPKG